MEINYTVSSKNCNINIYDIYNQFIKGIPLSKPGYTIEDFNKLLFGNINNILFNCCETNHLTNDIFDNVLSEILINNSDYNNLIETNGIYNYLYSLKNNEEKIGLLMNFLSVLSLEYKKRIITEAKNYLQTPIKKLDYIDEKEIDGFDYTHGIRKKKPKKYYAELQNGIYLKDGNSTAHFNSNNSKI